MKRQVFWIFAVVAFGLIIWGGLAPSDPMPKLFIAQDKFEHAFAFALLAGTLTMATSRPIPYIILTLTVVLGFGIEIGQAMFTKFREPSVQDAVASLIGALMGVSAGVGLRDAL